MTIGADLDARGSSLSALMAGLNGTLVIEIRGAETRNKELREFGQALFTQINPLSKTEEITPLLCIAAELVVEDGLLRSRKGPIIVTERAAWFVHSTIDLRNETLEVHGRPRPRRGFGLTAGALAGLLEVSGPISSPQLKVDPRAVGGEVTSIMKTLFSRAASVIKREQHDLDVCQKIRAALEPH